MSVSEATSEHRLSTTTETKRTRSATRNLFKRVGTKIAFMTSKSKNRKFINYVSDGNATAASELLDMGANVNKLTSSGHSALYVACARGHLQVAEVLLAAKAHYDTINVDSPFFVASEQGHTAIVDLLLMQPGLDLRPVSGLHPLHVGAQNGHLDVVSAILCWMEFHPTYTDLEKENIINVTAEKGALTPLMLASREGHSEVVQALVDVQVQIHMTNDKGNTALHLACEAGHYHAVYILLTAGSTVSILNSDGLNCMDIARSGSHSHLMNLLETTVHAPASITTSTTEDSEDFKTFDALHSVDIKTSPPCDPIINIILKNRMKYAHFIVLGKIEERQHIEEDDLNDIDDEPEIEPTEEWC